MWAIAVEVRCASVSYLNFCAEWRQSSPSVTFPCHFPSKRQNRRENVRKTPWEDEPYSDKPCVIVQH